jgi:hypothetical protein
VACKDPKLCFYLFSVYFQGGTDAVALRTPMMTSLQIMSNTADSQVVSLD